MIKNREGFRFCIKCKIEKELNPDNFHRDKNRVHGFMYKCKTCEAKRVDKRIYAERWRKMSPIAKEVRKKAQYKYSRTPMGKAIFSLKAYENADKRKGFETSIDKKDILVAMESLCVYCGFPATGFDRKDNKTGHTKENCVPSCKECNVARMDNFSHEETFVIGHSIRLIKAKREKIEFGNCVY